jgi:hypothetical protein
MFEKRVLRKIFGSKRDEVRGEWWKLHSGELHNLCSSPDIIKLIKLRRTKWVGRLASMGEGRKVYKVSWESPKERNHLVDGGVDGSVGLECILGRLADGVWSGFTYLRIGTGGGLL